MLRLLTQTEQRILQLKMFTRKNFVQVSRVKNDIKPTPHIHQEYYFRYIHGPTTTHKCATKWILPCRHLLNNWNKCLSIGRHLNERPKILEHKNILPPKEKEPYTKGIQYILEYLNFIDSDACWMNVGHEQN